jgi:hypothetical protein
MTQDVLWITEDYVKDNSILNENVDWRLAQPILILVQDQYIHPILGTALFDEIADEIYAGSVSTNNQTLLDRYIRKVIMWYLMSELVPILKYRMRNKGVMTSNSENSQPASLEEIQKIQNDFKNKAEWYSEMCTKFLRENSSTYTNYFANTVNSDDLVPNGQNFTTTIYLDDDCDECKKNLYK